MKLMAVGDDWQSIYRFSGSDISVMTNFEAHFGRHEQRLLPETFRFDQMVEKVASRFVLQNKSQLEKVIKARAGSGKKSVILWHPKEKGAPILESIAKLIPKAPDGKVQDVLILARYKFYNNEIDYSKLKQQRPDLNWSFSTVHAAKGAEADYAIILGVKSRGSAFPSEIADDPLLSLVLAKQELYPNAEERRLFYVALTRTKNSVYVVGDPSSESVFFRDLIKDEDVDTTYIGKTLNRHCPDCKAAMAERNSAHGLFFGCTNFPICEKTSKPCTTCGVGFLKRDEKAVKCDNEACMAEHPVCPKCKDGTLVKRSGTKGPFLGCSNFSRGICDFTRRI
jgi:DNA helicase-4